MVVVSVPLQVVLGVDSAAVVVVVDIVAVVVAIHCLLLL